MSESLVEANLAAQFAMVDQDGDGIITADDFQLLAEQICTGFAVEPGSANHRRIRDAFTGWWERLRQDADIDHGGTVNKQEYIEASRTGMTASPQFVEVLTQLAEVCFDAIDRDGDGLISKAEYVRVYHVAGQDPEAGKVAFDRIDTDGDGSITCDELVTAVRELVTSQDPSAPGAWMFGVPNR